MPDLNPKQARFVEEYLLDLNGKQAAIRAGYSEKTADAQASRLLTHVKVATAVAAGLKARSERTEITQDYVLTGLRTEAEFKGEGATSSARIRAYELLGKHLGLFAEKHEHSGPNGQPIPVSLRVEYVSPNHSNP